MQYKFSACRCCFRSIGFAAASSKSPSTINRCRSFRHTAHIISRGKICSAQDTYTSQQGVQYRVKDILQEEQDPLRQVYRATDTGGRDYILKHIPPVNFSYLTDEIYSRLRACTNHVRLPLDTIPHSSMFVFEYFTSHPLGLVQQDLPLTTTKTILKQALSGIAELHDQDIVHTDIKADNIFIDWERISGAFHIKRVQLADLEDAAHLPPGTAVIGKQAGNYMWRSPEAHASGPVGKPSDIFSFAIVMIYAVTKRVILHITDDELDDGKLERVALVIERQMSLFGEWDSINDMIANHLDAENPFGQIFSVTRDGFGGQNPRAPFKMMKDFDQDFKDLIVRMTDFSPKNRITAREALQHRWFSDL